MKLLKCNNGHFYDGDKFSDCPHCQTGANTGFGGAQNSGYLADEKTEPVAGWNNAQAGSFGGDVTLPSENWGAAGSSVNAQEITAPSGHWGGSSAQGKDATVPADDWAKVKAPEKTLKAEEDDEKTQGMFIIPDINVASPTIPVSAAKKSEGLAAGWFVCIKGVNKGRDFRLAVGRNSIGRSESNDVALIGDNTVSREPQAVLVYEPKGNKFYVLPGSTRSLSYLNGDVLLSKTEMKKNDILEMGGTELMLIPCCDERFNWGDIFETN